MNNFFEYHNPFRGGNFYDLSFLEIIIPLSMVYMILAVILLYKMKFIEHDWLNLAFRYVSLGLLALCFISYYVMVWSNEGFSYKNLPLDLYSILTYLSIALLLTNNKKIFSIVLYLGIIVGMINLLTNQVGYSYQSFRYYQFMMANGLFIIIPIYYIIVYEFNPTLKELFYSYVVIQIGFIMVLLLNLILKSNYMFLSFTKNDAYAKTFMYYLGKWPLNIIWVELIGIILLPVIYGALILINNQNTVDDVVISNQSFYHKDKKKK